MRALAFYLPQFHPIPENDHFWGAGFTEWANVAKARPLFRGHRQPQLPGELGFYDLRVPETRVAQATLARSYGIEGFIYWHYWFGGRRLLERPFAEVLASGEPDFPFCLAWANQSWTGIWHGAPNRTLVEQTYPGREDYRRHFESLVPALTDSRYITVDGKPLLIIFRPTEVPDPELLVEEWRTAAERAGLAGIHLVGMDMAGEFGDPGRVGFDATILNRLSRIYELKGRHLVQRLRWGLHRHSVSRRLDPWRGRPLELFRYDEASALLVPPSSPPWESYPCVYPNWDNTPRSGTRGIVLTDSTPASFERQVAEAVRFVRHLPPAHRIITVKSWNEWAEGNYLEPDERWGRSYLEAFARAVGHEDGSRGPTSAVSNS